MKVCVIGAGNVASHLAPALHALEGVEVAQVWSRNIDNAQRLADRLNTAAKPPCRPIGSLTDLDADAHLYLLCVHDDAIAQIASQVPNYPGIWAHTSGSTDIDILKQAGKSRCGVLYPLQTFSRQVAVDVSRVPFFVEGDCEATDAELSRLARRLSPTVNRADSSLRRRLHVAAVFACNFANLMWMEADELLRRDNLDISVMRPLIEASVAKLSTTTPADAMTGPARRGDTVVIEAHEAMLPPDKAEIYRQLSQEIMKKF